MWQNTNATLWQCLATDPRVVLAFDWSGGPTSPRCELTWGPSSPRRDFTTGPTSPDTVWSALSRARDISAPFWIAEYSIIIGIYSSPWQIYSPHTIEKHCKNKVILTRFGTLTMCKFSMTLQIHSFNMADWPRLTADQNCSIRHIAGVNCNTPVCRTEMPTGVFLIISFQYLYSLLWRQLAWNGTHSNVLFLTTAFSYNHLCFLRTLLVTYPFACINPCNTYAVIRAEVRVNLPFNSALCAHLPHALLSLCTSSAIWCPTARHTKRPYFPWKWTIKSYRLSYEIGKTHRNKFNHVQVVGQKCHCNQNPLTSIVNVQKC